MSAKRSVFHLNPSSSVSVYCSVYQDLLSVSSVATFVASFVAASPPPHEDSTVLAAIAKVKYFVILMKPLKLTRRQ